MSFQKTDYKFYVNKNQNEGEQKFVKASSLAAWNKKLIWETSEIHSSFGYTTSITNVFQMQM